MRILLPILFCVLGIFARADDELVRCRTTLSHVVMEKNAMGPSDLVALARAPLGANPAEFANWRSGTERLVFERTFTTLLTGPRRDEVARGIRAEAMRLARALRQSGERRRGAKVETAWVVHPKLIRHLDERDLEAPTLFEHDGQTMMAAGTTSGRELVIINLATLEAKHSPVAGIGESAPHFLKLGHTPALLYAGEAAGRGLNLVDLEGEPHPALVQSPHSRLVERVGGVIQHAGNSWAVTYGGVRETDHVLIPIGQPDVAPRLLETSHGMDGGWQVAGPRLLAFSTSKTLLRVFDFEKGTSSSKSVGHVGHQHAQFFTDASGETRILVTGPAGIFVDGGNGVESIHPSRVSLKPTIFTSAGRTKAALMGFRQLELLDLHDHRATPLGAVENVEGVPRHFNFRDHDFLVWPEGDGAISILDVASPDARVTKTLLQHRVKTLMPFATKDGVSAVVQDNRGKNTSIIQLIGSPE